MAIHRKRFSVVLSDADIARLVEALDSHEYWQLSEENERHSGYVVLPGDCDEEEEDEESEAHAEIRACRKLAERLDAVRKGKVKG